MGQSQQTSFCKPMDVFVFVCDSDSGVLTEELAHTYGVKALLTTIIELSLSQSSKRHILLKKWVV